VVGVDATVGSAVLAVQERHLGAVGAEVAQPNPAVDVLPEVDDGRAAREVVDAVILLGRDRQPGPVVRVVVLPLSPTTSTASSAATRLPKPSARRSKPCLPRNQPSDRRISTTLSPGRSRSVTSKRWTCSLRRGPYTLRGYFRAPEHNMRAFTPTGSTAQEEIENLILAHPGVQNVACIPVPDDVLGERMCACFIPQARAQAPTLDELVRFLQGHEIATFKLPERLEVLDTFPLPNRQSLQEGPDPRFS
jgi:AMP-binding enzyme